MNSLIATAAAEDIMEAEHQASPLPRRAPTSPPVQSVISAIAAADFEADVGPKQGAKSQGAPASLIAAVASEDVLPQKEHEESPHHERPQQARRAVTAEGPKSLIASIAAAL